MRVLQWWEGEFCGGMIDGTELRFSGAGKLWRSRRSFSQSASSISAIPAVPQ